MILKDTATFQVLFFIVSLFCAWNITTVETNSGVDLLKTQICQVPLFASGGLGLLGVKNLVLFTSLVQTQCLSVTGGQREIPYQYHKSVC